MYLEEWITTHQHTEIRAGVADSGKPGDLITVLNPDTWTFIFSYSTLRYWIFTSDFLIIFCLVRNLQMLLSHLLNSTEYRGVLVENLSGNRNLVPQNISLNRNLVDRVGMPSIPRLQELLEQAWRAGFDRAGCEQLGGKIVNTR